jgi:hypothetical protein
MGLNDFVSVILARRIAFVRLTAYAVISDLPDHMLPTFPITSLTARTCRWQRSDLFKPLKLTILVLCLYLDHYL